MHLFFPPVPGMIIHVIQLMHCWGGHLRLVIEYGRSR